MTKSSCQPQSKHNNQRRFTMLYVGIDVAKYKHDIAVIDEFGNIILEHMQIKNNHEGFYQLHTWLSHHVENPNDIRIALEDTGHYSRNIVMFLRANFYPTFSYNPYLIKEFAKSVSLRKTKTDKKDALTIARKLASDMPVMRQMPSQDMDDLKVLTRHRDRIKRKMTDFKVQYVKILDLIFPELAKIVNLHNQSTRHLIEKYPIPAKIIRANKTSIYNIKNLKADKAKSIIIAARTTVGNTSWALEFELKQTLQAIRYFEKLMTEINTEIQALMDKLDQVITSVPGISTTLGSIILAEIRNIENFRNPNQLLAFAGLEPSVNQSGDYEHTGKMVKRGSTHLRWALLQAAEKVAIYSPTFKRYLALKRSQGKHYNKAKSHVAKKLVRVLFYLLKNHKYFDENLLT